MIEIPESYRAYRADRATKAAYDLIIASSALPSGLAMEEWPTFYQVRLASERVQTDFYTLLHDLWMKTWGDALSRHFPTLEPMRSGDRDADPSLSTVWTDRSLGAYVALPDGGTLWAEVDLQQDRDLRIRFYVEDDGDYSWSDAVMLSAHWLDVDDDSWRASITVPVDADASALNLQPLCAAAADVAETLADRAA